MKDATNQTYIWSFISSVLAWFSNHQNLMLLSLGIAIITSLINLLDKRRERKRKEREHQRAEELHSIKIARLKQGLEYDIK